MVDTTIPWSWEDLIWRIRSNSINILEKRSLLKIIPTTLLKRVAGIFFAVNPIFFRLGSYHSR